MDPFENLNKMLQKAHELDGKKLKIPMEDLMDHGYLTTHTDGRFESFDEFVKASGFGNIPFEEIPDDDWDKWISSNTDMSNWEDMKQDAVSEYSDEYLKNQFDL